MTSKSCVSSIKKRATNMEEKKNLESVFPPRLLMHDHQSLRMAPVQPQWQTHGSVILDDGRVLVTDSSLVPGRYILDSKSMGLPIWSRLSPPFLQSMYSTSRATSIPRLWLGSSSGKWSRATQKPGRFTLLNRP